MVFAHVVNRGRPGFPGSTVGRRFLRARRGGRYGFELSRPKFGAVRGQAPPTVSDGRGGAGKWKVPEALTALIPTQWVGF